MRLLRGHKVAAVEAVPFAVSVFFVDEIEDAVGGDEHALGLFVGADDGFAVAAMLDVLDGDFPEVVDFLEQGFAFVDGEGGLVADEEGHDALGVFDLGDAEDFDDVAVGELEGLVVFQAGGDEVRGEGKNGGQDEDEGEGEAAVHKVSSGTQAKWRGFGKQSVSGQLATPIPVVDRIFSA